MESWPCYARTLKDRYYKMGRRFRFNDVVLLQHNIYIIMFYRYSEDTIEALETLDSDDKIDLELIVSLIRQIVLNVGVSLMWHV